jgi:hypothetical protein
VRQEQESVALVEQALTQYRQDVAAAEQSVTGGQRLVAATQSRADRLAEQFGPAELEAREAAAAVADLPVGAEPAEVIDMTAADAAMVEADTAVDLARQELSSQEQRRASLIARCEALRSAVSHDADISLPEDQQHGSLDSLIRVRPGHEKAVAVLLGAHARATVLRSTVTAGQVLGGTDAEETMRFVLSGVAVAPEPAAVLSYIEAPDYLRGALSHMLRDCRIADSLEEAERMVAARYEEFFAAGYVPFPELTENRRKMARLPAGAEPLVNPIGGAPGVLCRSGETRIVSLPGVPGELMAIVDESFGPLVAEIFGDAHYEERSLEVGLQDESAIADILRAAEEQHPAVYVKSRAKVLGSTRVIRITLSGRGESPAAVAALLAPAADQLLAQIAAAGFTARPAPPEDPAATGA